MTIEFATSIVIPAFNEASRLPSTLAALVDQHATLDQVNILEVIIVDDGSDDGTTEVAQEFEGRLPSIVVVTLPKNRGKGFAVRQGILAATSDWVLIADADMSTPWDQVCKLSKHVEDGSFDVAIGSRGLADSDVAVRQSFLREHLGKAFNLLIRLLTRLPFSDTQCGFKLVRRTSAELFLADLTIDRFAWDVEFLILASDHGARIVEVPVIWEHRDASRVHPLFDGLDMAATVFGLQLRRLFKKKRSALEADDSNKNREQ